MQKGERRLAAIMFTDMVGYTALSQQNETLALDLLEEHRRILRPLFPMYNGREIKTIGDGFLTEFASANDAVRCAIDVQKSLRDRNLPTTPERQISVRIGIHLGDVIHDQDDVYGDAVNIASRIEPLADPGGICASGQVRESVQGIPSYKFQSLEKPELKNVTGQVTVFKILLPWETTTPTIRQQSKEPFMNRIAVLPFVNISPNPKDEFLADGMTEELISRLAQAHRFEVIARTSAMSYKNKEMKVSEIGRELNAGTLVEGSVRKAGNRIRVTVQVVDANTEGHLWVTSYDRELDDIFRIQSEIASKVVDSIPARYLGPSIKGQGITEESAETGNLAAYTLFLQGRQLMYERTEEPLRHALRFFEQAVQSDPSFARAHASLAECHLRMGNRGYEPYLTSIEKSKVALRKALSIDDRLAEAHSTLSNIGLNEDNFASAESEARRAIQLNPNLTGAYLNLSEVRATLGYLDEVVALLETAYRLDPLAPRVIDYLGRAYFYSGMNVEAREHWKRTLHLVPLRTYDMMTEYHLSARDFDEAARTSEMLEKLAPRDPRTILWAGYLAAAKGQREKALGMIGLLEDLAKEGSLTVYLSGFIHYALEDLDSFFECMRRALQIHALPVIELRFCPLFVNVRKDPRMKELFAQLGLSLEVDNVSSPEPVLPTDAIWP